MTAEMGVTDRQQNKKVLIVSFYFPPSSGAAVQRTLKAAEYLPEFGWDPIILTAKPFAYDSLENSQSIPTSLTNKVFRTSAWDVNNHLSIKGKHLGWMSSIDRWSTWIPGAIFRGLKIIREYKPDLILSTTPTPSANIIARALSKITKTPWVADYQDPFSYHNYPTSWLKIKAQKSIDKSTIHNCSAAIFATPNAQDLYKKAFPSVPEKNFHVVENGFDEKNWQKIENYKPLSSSPFNQNKFSLFYSGVLYSNGRNPDPLFRALNLLKSNNLINSDNFELIFQGSGNGENFKTALNDLDITDLVRFTDNVPYLDSLFFMTKAAALILIQDKVFNLQVPGKLYEYFRSGRPVLTITPQGSATAKTASSYPLSRISNKAEGIADIISDWFKNHLKSHNSTNLQHFSRHSKTSEFAKVFDLIVGGNDKKSKFH
ncbi:MAG: hypothetical protein ACJAS1_002086 [Oleiphilaceae bacterium]|jgi:hypothetical protein